jgi:hypothetical protein
MNLQQDKVFPPDLYNAHLSVVGEILAYDTRDCGVRLHAMDTLCLDHGYMEYVEMQTASQGYGFEMAVHGAEMGA